MKTKGIQFCMTILSICALSFLLNYVWESYHAVLLYEAHDFNASKYVRMLTYAAAVDSLLISGIHLFISALWRNIFWLQRTNRKQVYTAAVAGLVTAAIIEYRKVIVLKAWSYLPHMPTVFGIGLSPLLQLSVTAVLTFWLTRRLWYQKGIY